MAAQVEPRSASSGTRDRIIDAAEHLISLHGTEGFQLKDVADFVGIRPPSVYAHFDGKAAISHEVSLRFYRGILLELVADDFENADPSELMKGLISRGVRYFENHPGHLRLVLRDLAQSASEQAKTDSSTWKVWSQMELGFEKILIRGIEAGQFRSIRPAAALSQIVGAIVANLCWYGWDGQGSPKSGAEVSEILEESQEMAMRLLRC